MWPLCRYNNISVSKKISIENCRQNCHHIGKKLLYSQKDKMLVMSTQKSLKFSLSRLRNYFELSSFSLCLRKLFRETYCWSELIVWSKRNGTYFKSFKVQSTRETLQKNMFKFIYICNTAVKLNKHLIRDCLSLHIKGP